MALDIMLDLDRLRATQDGLKASVDELTNASSINDGLESAIDRPDDRSELRDKSSDFESAWDGKRKKLSDNLENIQEQLKSIIDGWTEWDTETASSLTPDTATQSVNANRIA